MLESSSPMDRPRRSEILLFTACLAVGALVCAMLVGPRCAVTDAKTLAAQSPPAIETGLLKEGGSMPAPFAGWPAKKPDAVLVISGQLHAYLQKCGCSDPQMGGLERRHNFIQGLKGRGWDVLPIDLGGLNEDRDETKKPIVKQQALMKYNVAMQSMKVMGYKAVGIAKEEASLPLIDALAGYSLQAGNELPEVLSANVSIPGLSLPGLPLIKTSNVYETGQVKIGVTSLVGKTLMEQMLKTDSKLAFAFQGQKNGEILAKEKQLMIDQKAQVRILLYNESDDPAKQGVKGLQNPFQSSMDLVKIVANWMPANSFDIIVRRSDESAPTRHPVEVNGSTILDVGQKGQNIVVVGLFKTAKGFDFKFETVTLTPEYETPKDGKNPILDELEKYSSEVQREGLLAKYPKIPHQAQLQIKAAAFTGSQACSSCHLPQWNQYQKVNANGLAHSVAYATLENAKRPSKRQYDPECIVCHTVGFEFNTGFIDEIKQPQLKNVGCENCHGPGSEHVAEETKIAAGQKLQRQTLQLLSPWKTDGKGAMPDEAKLKQIASGADIGKVLNLQEYKVFMRVDQMCLGCHNTDADPHFKLENNWSKVSHTFPAKP